MQPVEKGGQCGRKQEMGYEPTRPYPRYRLAWLFADGGLSCDILPFGEGSKKDINMGYEPNGVKLSQSHLVVK